MTSSHWQCVSSFGLDGVGMRFACTACIVSLHGVQAQLCTAMLPLHAHGQLPALIQDVFAVTALCSRIYAFPMHGPLYKLQLCKVEVGAICSASYYASLLLQAEQSTNSSARAALNSQAACA